MNAGKLNKRLYFDTFTIYGQKIIKNKRRDDEQNEESYEFIIRKRTGIEEYQTFICDNISYIILTVDEYQKEKGYLLLRCEKAKIHSFYDTCTVSRLVETETEYGETIHSLQPIFTNIPCELIRIISASMNQTDQHNEVALRYELNLENQYTIKNGDKVEIVHKQDIYKAIVQSYFRTHTHQIVQIELEGEA
jgi:hypothetical protein